ncbi:PREDICTED: mucin-19-like [Dipodomys ordii]|uniref:Mucin-19-like n=1 Tax=Dipodomys ordii TaxID=10020 RepID=A0A1S3FDQ3_DIPOR|nr:PREDICTED: mucin-19-like [Dipodomys ordii]
MEQKIIRDISPVVYMCASIGNALLGNILGNFGYGVNQLGIKGSVSIGSSQSDGNLGFHGSGSVSQSKLADFGFGERKHRGETDVGVSGSNPVGDTGLSHNDMKDDTRLSDITEPPGSFAAHSTPEKGSHIPEATPTYSETNEVIGEASTWGSGVYKAFNGYIFSFTSPCTYTFCRDCAESGDFHIEIKRNNKNEIEKIKILVDGNDISISGDTILLNEKSISIPHSNKMIHIKKQGKYNVLKGRRGMLTLVWLENSLSLTLHKQYTTCGLCGNFNTTPGQDINEHIANSKISGDCPDAVSKSYEVCEDGEQHCNKIIGTYFEQCGKVAPLAQQYKRVCVDEYCHGHGDVNATCNTYEELSRLCASEGPSTFEHWRDDSDVVCEKPKCPEKHIYKECGPSNPPTCSNVAPFQDSECVSGCTCPDGYLLDDIGGKGKCVLKEKCPCESSGNIYQPGEVRAGACGSQCTCHEAKWSCTESLCPGRCKVEGSLFTTFDDNKFNHPGNCHFLAIHNEDLSVGVELHPCAEGQTGTCLNRVSFLLNSSASGGKFVFNSDGTVTNDVVRIQDSYNSDEVQISKPTSSYFQVETYLGVKMQIQYFPVMQLYVSVPPNQFSDTVGLCGSYNNKAEDDFLSSQNILEKTSHAFANSWEMAACPKGTPSTCISIETEKFAENKCGILLDSSGPFASCHSVVNPKFYHEECNKYTCSCENSQECLCTILDNYVKACAVKGENMAGWRAGLCEQTCPSGLVFKYNVKACNRTCRSLSQRDRSCDLEDVPVDGCTCPDGMYKDNEGNCVQKSQCDCYVNDEVVPPGKLIHIDDNKCVCRNGMLLCQTPLDLTLQNCTGGAEYVDCKDPKAQRRSDKTCSTRNIPAFDDDLPCKRGCYCPVGMVRNSKGRCVLPDDCPCSFGEQEYEQGSVTAVGCNECTCINGSWNCTQNECQTTCHIYGEGHVRTFDGESYSFDGLCQYTFLEDYCGRENGTFRILTESVPCCEDGLTCSRKIVVAFQDHNIVLQEGKVTAVKTTESKECELATKTYSIHTVGLYLIVKLANGIILIWDKYTKLSAILDPRWHGQVCGLCGNNNGDLKDDFTTRHSSVAGGALEFGNSWKTSQECSNTVTQSFPCDSNPYCKAWAVRKCEILRDSTFQACHSKVDPTAYYEACVEEACACDVEGKYPGFCTAVATYAEACNAAGVCVSWRKPSLCPVYCDYYNTPGECSWHYEPCGTVMAKTCKDRVIGQKFSALLEGCYAKCPESAPYLDENTMKCVGLSECSCFYNDVIPAGGVVQDDCGRTCYCIAGELECNATTLISSRSTTGTTAVSAGSTAAHPRTSDRPATTSGSSSSGTTVLSAASTTAGPGSSARPATTSARYKSGTTGPAAGESTGAPSSEPSTAEAISARTEVPTSSTPIGKESSTLRESSPGTVTQGNSGTTGQSVGRTSASGREITAGPPGSETTAGPRGTQSTGGPSGRETTGGPPGTETTARPASTETTAGTRDRETTAGVTTAGPPGTQSTAGPPGTTGPAAGETTTTPSNEPSTAEATSARTEVPTSSTPIGKEASTLRESSPGTVTQGNSGTTGQSVGPTSASGREITAGPPGSETTAGPQGTQSTGGPPGRETTARPASTETTAGPASTETTAGPPGRETTAGGARCCLQPPPLQAEDPQPDQLPLLLATDQAPQDQQLVKLLEPQAVNPQQLRPHQHQRVSVRFSVLTIGDTCLQITVCFFKSARTEVPTSPTPIGKEASTLRESSPGTVTQGNSGTTGQSMGPTSASGREITAGPPGSDTTAGPRGTQSTAGPANRETTTGPPGRETTARPASTETTAGTPSKETTAGVTTAGPPGTQSTAGPPGSTVRSAASTTAGPGSSARPAATSASHRSGKEKREPLHVQVFKCMDGELFHSQFMEHGANGKKYEETGVKKGPGTTGPAAGETTRAPSSESSTAEATSARTEVPTSPTPIGKEASTLRESSPGTVTQGNSGTTDNSVGPTSASGREITAGPPGSETTAGPPNTETTVGPPNTESTAGPPNTESTAGPPNTESTAGPPDGETTARPASTETTARTPDRETTARPPRKETTPGTPGTEATAGVTTTGPPGTQSTVRTPSKETTAGPPGTQTTAGPLEPVEERVELLLQAIVKAHLETQIEKKQKQRGKQW